MDKLVINLDNVQSKATLLIAVLFLLFTGSSLATNFKGTVTNYPSPSGTQEQCIAIEKVPGGIYSDSDRSVEQEFCTIDFYSGDYGLCPKVFSTSPGTLIYDLTGGEFAGKADTFEKAECATRSPHKRGSKGAPVSYKMTMNDRSTSATFSTASLLYYHFSRYFNADVHVPVSVYRSMDRQEHLQRVTQHGLQLSSKSKSLRMNHAGWQVLEKAERNPDSYRATDELFNIDRQQVYGVLLQPHGDRYGAEINGTRKSGWGEGQNRDFQETAPFSALRSDLPLMQAIDAGIHSALEDRHLRQAMPHGASAEQMVYWMKELTEITLLDYIFSQQDRIGNIDYLSYWYWVDGGKVQRLPAHGTRLPDELAGKHAQLIKRTQLNDNDAGGRIPYANYTKKTRMLEKIRHFNADTYARLMALAADFSSSGDLFKYAQDSFGLSQSQFRQLVSNTQMAADILRSSCRSGKLRFDLEPGTLLISGEVKERTVDCDNP